MWRLYLQERLSWILLFLGLEGLILFVAAVDIQIPFTPVLYIVFLSTLIFLMFLTYRYYKETRFYNALAERDDNLDSTSIPEGNSPLERLVEQSMTGLTARLRSTSTHHQMALELEKDELLSWIHEVKTPLTAQRLIIDRLENETMKAALTYEWLRIHLLLDQQLHQKRLPFMENDLYIEQVDLETLLYMEIRTLQSWCMQKKLGFDLQLEVKEALSDGKWLAFILRQLLTNAVKYSEPGAPDIVIRCRIQEGRTLVEIEDSGRGIDSRDLPRIFERGFTSTIRHQDSGATGMGLYLARKAAEPLLIHIGVRSEPGAGTTFTLTLPQRNAFDRMTGR